MMETYSDMICPIWNALLMIWGIGMSVNSLFTMMMLGDVGVRYETAIEYCCMKRMWKVHGYLGNAMSQLK